jgi:hypothetical protein
MRRRQGFDTSNFDPLMDVVTNVVGVMLFVVIFAVMEARGSTVRMLTPLLSQPGPGQSRVLYLCEHGRIRQFGLDRALAPITQEAADLSFDRIPEFVRQFNDRNVHDEEFRYRLSWDTQLGLYNRRRTVSVTAEDLGTAATDDGLRRFEQSLDHLTPGRNWVSFLLDSESLDVFRKARDTAVAHGFAVGWDPGRLAFPMTQCVLGCGPRLAGLGAGKGPQN